MAQGSFAIRVEAAADPGGELVPRRFHLGRRSVEVVEVLDRWLGTDRSYFKVLGDDGDLYILRRDGLADHWELTLFTSAAVAAATC